MLTWSLGWAPPPASAAMTSLAFMLDEVPEPVWKTSIGNWSSCSPRPTASAAPAIDSARAGSSFPSSALDRAAAPLMGPSQWITAAGTGSAAAGTVWPEIGKLSPAFFVSPPYRVFLAMRGRLSTEGRQLPCHPHGVVVGDEVAG